MWLVPWSHTKKLADDYDDMMYLARQATEAIQKVHGSQYRLGTTPSLLYTTSGIIDTRRFTKYAQLCSPPFFP